jgi:ABC-2 type transport system ATP-binding protein
VGAADGQGLDVLRSIWNYIAELRKRENVTIFLTTHYMDEAEYCDRLAIIDQGKIIALGSPEELKANVGTDRVQIRTDDDDAAMAALRARFDLKPSISEGAITFGVAGGERFVPRLFAELPVAIRSVSVARPSLDDVFMSYTGTSIRDAESGAGAQFRRNAAIFGRGR